MNAEGRGLQLGLGVTAGLALIDALLGPSAAISGSYMLGAALAGVLAGFRAAAVVSVVAVALATVSPIWNEDWLETAYLVREGVVMLGSVFALAAGRLRDERSERLGQQDLLVTVADLPHAGASVRETAEQVAALMVPRYVSYAAVEAEVGGQVIRLAARGTEPTEPEGRADTAIVTPLRARGRELGTITTAGRGRIAADEEFLRVVSGRIALALDNAGLSQELDTVEQQLAAILENLGEAVTVQDRSGKLVFANPAAAEVLGCASVEELLATPPMEIVSRFATFNEDGSPLRLDQIPGRHVLAGERPEPLVVRAVNLATGVERWRVTKSTPVRGPLGEVLLAVNVIEDITDAKRAELTQRLLADVSAALASSLDHTQTLERVADLVVPSLADECGVSVANEKGVSDDPPGSAEVLRTGASHLSPEVILVPLASREQTLGVMSLVLGDSGRQFTRADLELAEELGRRVGTALENSRLYAQLESVATTLQRSLLPPALPEVPGWRFRSLYMPAGGGETDVGGDFYDVFPTAAGWMAVMGDVAGRGPAAASLTAMGRYTLRTAGSLVGTPTMGLGRLNENLRARGDMAHCTVAIILLREDGDEASLVSAGHPLPYLVREGRVEEVGRTGPLLGAFDNGHWLPATVRVEPGDLLILYTDGVVDARGRDDRFGETRLQEALAGTADVDDAVGRIREALHDFAGGEQDDDTAVLAMQRV